jgi:hypothetical protein
MMSNPTDSITDNGQQWWLSNQGTPAGPYGEAFLLAGIKTGTISPQTHVCPIGGQEWKRLSQWPAFASACPVAAASPPPPGLPPLPTAPKSGPSSFPVTAPTSDEAPRKKWLAPLGIAAACAAALGMMILVFLWSSGPTTGKLLGTWVGTFDKSEMTLVLDGSGDFILEINGGSVGGGRYDFNQKDKVVCLRPFANEDPKNVTKGSLTRDGRIALRRPDTPDIIYLSHTSNRTVGKDNLTPREAASVGVLRLRKLTSTNNMKLIGLCMLGHEQANGAFPPAYRADDNGKPLLSWRVLILPYLQKNDLYKQFHLDEPWDSEHNKKLIDKMPAAYQSPGSKLSGQGKSNYLTVRGEGTMFPGKDGISVRDIRDGASNTIMTVEVSDEKAVIWTKPDDFEYDEKNPMKGLVGIWEGGFICGLADGEVRFMSSSVSPKMLIALFTRNGGEMIDWSETVK